MKETHLNSYNMMVIRRYIRDNGRKFNSIIALVAG